MKRTLLIVFAFACVVFAQEKPTCTCPNCGLNPVDYKKLGEANRFNPKDAEIADGVYMTKGTYGKNPIYCVSGYMDISDAPAGSMLKSNIGIRFMTFFDKDKKYLSFVENQNPAEIPQGAAFARQSFTKNLTERLDVRVVPPKPVVNNEGGKMGFVNDICMPSVLYMLSDTQNDIFVQPMLKRWRPYDDYVRFSLDKGGQFMRNLSSVASITEPVDGSTLTTAFINGDEFETVKTLKSRIVVGKKGTGEGAVTVQVIGDSLTHGGFFRHALLEAGFVPGIKMIGLRRCADGQYDEGRGGWRLDSYFTVPRTAMGSYHGFMQPEGDIRYYGNRAFWKTCWTVFRKTAPKGFQPGYNCGRFDDVLPRFDEATGTLLNPKAGDLQMDEESKSLVLFDGNAWVPKQNEEFKWVFDYPKYLEMWNLEAPEFLFVNLGINDFCNHLEADFEPWKKMITTMKESYLKARPDGKFAICLPCTTLGSIDNQAGTFIPKQNAAMWRFRKWLIDTFDKREKDGFYLVDTSITCDNENGFNLVTKGDALVPFPGYKGDVRLKIQTGNPHPYPAYPFMATPLAAFIQALRK